MARIASAHEPESILVENNRIACDGGVGPLGHPRVWLQIDDKTGIVICGYCDRRYIKKGGPADEAG